MILIALFVKHSSLIYGILHFARLEVSHCHRILNLSEIVILRITCQNYVSVPLFSTLIQLAKRLSLRMEVLARRKQWKSFIGKSSHDSGCVYKSWTELMHFQTQMTLNTHQEFTDKEETIWAERAGGIWGRSSSFSYSTLSSLWAFLQLLTSK